MDNGRRRCRRTTLTPGKRRPSICNLASPPPAMTATSISDLLWIPSNSSDFEYCSFWFLFVGVFDFRFAVATSFKNPSTFRDPFDPKSAMKCCAQASSPSTEMAEKERRILVAVDEGDESMYALSWCLHNLVFPNSYDTLILLHCKPSRLVYPALDGTGYLFSSDISATVERYSDQVADGVIEKAKKLCIDLQQVKVETRVENGDPRDVICEMAEKLGADVVVMGSHGYGVIKRALLGSVSNHCAQNVKCPVLIVKKPKT